MVPYISSLAHRLTRVLYKPSMGESLGADPAQGPGSLSGQNCLTEQFFPISILLKLSKRNKKLQKGTSLPSVHVEGNSSQEHLLVV